jgi:antitoxin (DNA-binding transcriptional repressor) of toxin-antitoxin stability system
MQINMHEAKSQLSKLVQAALDGEEVIIARNGAPVVQITKFIPAKIKRKPGAWEGTLWLADDWDSTETNRMINDQLQRSVLFPAEPVAYAVNEPQRPYKVTPKKRAAMRGVKRNP